jgi:hypothetical protein
MNCSEEARSANINQFYRMSLAQETKMFPASHLNREVTAKIQRADK